MTENTENTSWVPLPKFGYGFAIYPFTPGSRNNSSDSTKDEPVSDGVTVSDATSISSANSILNSNSSITSYQVALEIGDEVYVFEQQGAWYRGYVVSQLRQTEEPQVYVGIFPVNHVYIKEHLDYIEVQAAELKSNDTASLDSEKNTRPPPPLPSLECGDDTVSGKTEPLVDEIASTVREWSSLLPKYLSERKYSMFRNVKDQINDLLQGRRQLLAQTLSQDELSKLRKELINKLVAGNLIQELDIIVRDPERGFLADETNISAIPSPLQSLHNPTPTDSTSHIPKFYHVFLDLKAWVASICSPGEFTELYFSLYTKVDSRFITEEYLIVLNHNGVPKDESKIGKIRTLFTDLSPHDIQDQVYLLCRIVRTGSMKMIDKDVSKESGAVTSLFSKTSKDSDNTDQISLHSNAKFSPQTFRRPFGCAVLDISHLLQGKEKETFSEH
ncbi:13625_t:CDS:2, partial [Dentiscutata heterogama]